MSQSVEETNEFYDIEWDDLDKTKFFFYGSTLFFGVRAMFYPPTLIKTRMQVDPGQTYKSALDATGKIIQREGFRGLYKGFWLSSANLIFRQAYFSTFEVVRKALGQDSKVYALLGPGYGEMLRNLAAGGSAQVVFQTITVPIDVVTQRLMVAGAFASGPHAPAAAAPYAAVGPSGTQRPLSTAAASPACAPPRQGAVAMATKIWAEQGWKGFYRGYSASILQFAPNSAIWWTAYGAFLNPMNAMLDATFPLSPEQKKNSASRDLRQQIVQAMAALCAGTTSLILTNPLDVIRTRLQVSHGGRSSIKQEFKILWAEGGLLAMFKGLGPRIVAFAPASVIIITVYDLIKRLSLKESVTKKHRKNSAEELSLECSKEIC